MSTDWTETHASRVVTAAEAVRRVRPGHRVFVGTGCGEPRLLVRALAARADELADVEMMHFLNLGDAPFCREDLSDSFRINSYFITENVRAAIQKGLGDYTPVFLSDIPRMMRSGELPLDVALIAVAPPDDNGMCSLGVSVDIVRSAAQNAALVIAEVNQNMPRTHGDNRLHIHDFDLLVASEEPIVEVAPPAVDDTTRAIAGHVAGLIDDGSTVELGIGRIPQALTAFLTSKKDLGIHTEMISDGIIDLVESGAVTGARKSLDRGRIVTSFCLGTRRLYDYIDDNPLFAFHPTEYVNDPFVISRQNRMVAVNVAIEVDLTGQVCADSIGSKFYSGIGGQVDFNRGALRAEGGKAIIAMPSTARGGKVSRIVAHLSKGAGVVTTRGDVQYVVTEYGVAHLHGVNIHDRTIALISIAHPDFRAGLLEEAIRANYLSAEMIDKKERLITGPKMLQATCVMPDGTQIRFRPVHPTDEPRLRRLFYRLSDQALYTRFMRFMKRLTPKQLDDFVFIDHRTELAMVGTIPVPGDEEIIALCQYYLDPATNRAEVAFTVHDRWQGKGLGSFMFQRIVQIAKRYGIKGLTADVLVENQAMARIFTRAPLKTRITTSGGVQSFTMDF